MKKLILVFVFALLGSYSQSAKAQTFSRVVTVNRDTTLNVLPNLYSGLPDSFTTLYEVPTGKIFKLEFFSGFSLTSNNPKPIFCKFNNYMVVSYKNNYNISNYTPSYLNDPIWLKAGDIVSIPIEIYSGYGNRVQVFLSGIEYDAQ